MTLVLFAKRWLCSPKISGIFRSMTKDWPRLAQAVAARRRELGLSQDAIRRAGGPSDVVIARIENDECPRPRDDTVNKLDGPLRWEPGSAQRVLAGADPNAIDRPLALQEIAIDELLHEIRRRFEALQSLGPSVRPVVPVSEDEPQYFPTPEIERVRDTQPGEVAGEDRKHNG